MLVFTNARTLLLFAERSCQTWMLPLAAKEHLFIHMRDFQSLKCLYNSEIDWLVQNKSCLESQCFSQLFHWWGKLIVPCLPSTGASEELPQQSWHHKEGGHRKSLPTCYPRTVLKCFNGTQYEIPHKLKLTADEWGPCALCHGIRDAIDAILACHPSSVHKMTGLGGKKSVNDDVCAQSPILLILVLFVAKCTSLFPPVDLIQITVFNWSGIFIPIALRRLSWIVSGKLWCTVWRHVLFELLQMHTSLLVTTFFTKF